ncbi:unnamed protein product [Adineta steineri]|uniref:Apple domain-containing protein n=1 Tax=Adineta steineri TaxID=433720 RepID=A0A819FEK1_9BILA|nr:unnamed protein product [Adineta steineri]CAF3867220.1 unnamed protein product [Adineta steineri]
MKLLIFIQLILTTYAFAPDYFSITKPGNQFQPANIIELLAINPNIRTLIRCAILCDRNIQCRTFDYDSISKQCRLFEGSIDTGILLSVSSASVVGSIKIDESLYDLYNASSDACVNNRFLVSDTLNNWCHCPIHTYWNGSICVNQRYDGEVCASDNWCRTDLNITCVSSICTGNASSPLTSSSTVTTTITKTTSSTSTTSTTTTSSSTSTTTKTTSSTSTTSTTTTSSSTSTTTTSSSTSTTTKTTSSTSTTSTTTTSSSITTTKTTSSTSTTTAMATVAPPCTPQSVSNGTLLHITNPTSSIYPNYTCHAYTWTATALSATLSFFFRHDPGGWMIDDVSVYYGVTQKIINGGFETGNLTGWNYTGNCDFNVNRGLAYPGSSYAKSGSWYYYDRCAGNMMGDTISQTFSTIAGGTYTISFWLTNYDCCNATEIANITLI